MKIQTKRVFEPALKSDGIRVLVDRIWPRGISKKKLHADLWLKDAAPSTALRKWFGHDPARWAQFRERYFSELESQPLVVQQLLELAAQGQLTLLYSARDIQRNQAEALKDLLVARLETAPQPLRPEDANKSARNT